MSRLVHIEIPYESRHLTEAQIDRLMEVSFLPIRKPPVEKEGTEYAGKFYLYDADHVLVPEADLPDLNFKYTVVRRQRLDDDIETLQSRATTVINKKVNVSVPGFGLMCIDEVKVETDCCTDNLQGMLDAGWRILAICPQPDQRRPDYVLGRTKASFESTY